MPQEEEGFIREHPFRRSSTTRYQTIFFGLCYACNNFGQIAELTTGTITTLRAIHKGVIQEDLVKHREEVTIGLNL
jgi:hypothetical protein